MIARKDITEMRHDEDGVCIGFAVYVQEDEDAEPTRFGYVRNSNGWEVIALHRVVEQDRVYRCVYGLPKKDMSLEMVAAIGMLAIQVMIKDEAQSASMLDFALAEMLSGM